MVRVLKAVGVGNVHFSNMTLRSVLHVLNIRCNLISVSKITNLSCVVSCFTKDLNCVVVLFSSHSEFKPGFGGDDFALSEMVSTSSRFWIPH